MVGFGKVEFHRRAVPNFGVNLYVAALLSGLT